ncbi:MAG: hypothetical protein ACM3QS_03885 [Bacteroidota bacterium]
MSISHRSSNWVVLLRWIARIWSVLSALVLMLSAFDPGNQLGAAPALPVEWLLLSLYAWAAAGLLLASRWEFPGGALAIACMLIEMAGFRLVKGTWYPNAFAFAVPVVLFVLPGLLFLACWAASQRRTPVAG